MTAATNKVEVFNGFSDWVRFGQNGTVAANDPVEQEKDVKFTSLLANLVIFHTPWTSPTWSASCRPRGARSTYSTSRRSPRT
ncbi:Tn3 family transposase [Kitasatospora sp. NPDC058965]|uniref:Tn3 family transposase n=1 Tax=Kitasatospora sp. NPDC058965 TaxID=3346682 RepID=UPI00367DAECE